MIKSEVYEYNDAGWGDLLTSYNGESITYDAIGNPLSYYNGTRYTFSWTGRRLTGATIGTNEYDFTYNKEGIRTSKTKNGVVTKYSVSGNLVMAEETGNVYIVYVYDDASTPIGMLYGITNGSETAWTAYWYEKNLQGDIVAVYDEAGTKLISYTYDAWGNFTTTYHNGANANSIAAKNPFKYRGYYYDSDLSLYYLNTRYYDSLVGRFISPDNVDVLAATPDQLTDKNLYAYCDNNPVMRSDNGGEFWTTVGIMAIGGIVGAAINTVSSIVTQKSQSDEINWKSVLVAAATGFASGAVAASPLGTIGQAAVGGLVSGLSYVADCCVNDQPVQLDEALVSSISGVASGIISGPGVNHGKVLTNAIKSTKKTILRESRRANQKYAQKQISKAIAYRNNLLSSKALGGSIMFTATSFASNGICGWYNAN